MPQRFSVSACGPAPAHRAAAAGAARRSAPCNRPYTCQPLLATEATITFFGHTHIQGGFCTHGEEWETLRPVYRTKREMESCDLTITPGAKYLINPGSAGQPRDGDWRAACALLDTSENRVTFYRVPYDVKKAQERIFSAKLPDRLALRLSEGR